jgi:hypothetical protein
VKGLEQKSNYGRPDWSKLFCEYGKNHPSKEIGVFVCGPEVIAKQLSEQCDKNTAATNTVFRFNKENF